MGQADKGHKVKGAAQRVRGGTQNRRVDGPKEKVGTPKRVGDTKTESGHIHYQKWR